MPTAHPLFAAVQDAAATPGFSFLAFLNAIEGYLLTLGKQAIDTPEERAAIEGAILEAFNTYVAPLMRPIAAIVIRKNLMTIVDDFLVALSR